jgi:hypothetical protein
MPPRATVVASSGPHPIAAAITPVPTDRARSISRPGIHPNPNPSEPEVPVTRTTPPPWRLAAGRRCRRPSRSRPPLAGERRGTGGPVLAAGGVRLGLPRRGRAGRDPICRGPRLPPRSCRSVMRGQLTMQVPNRYDNDLQMFVEGMREPHMRRLRCLTIRKPSWHAPRYTKTGA